MIPLPRLRPVAAGADGIAPCGAAGTEAARPCATERALMPTADRGARGRLARLLGWREDPGPAETSARGLDLRWPALLSLNAAAALGLGAWAANASRAGGAHAVEVFYLAIAMAYLPFAVRALAATMGRGEHLANVLLLTAALYAFKMLREPVAFIDHDEFLHWSTADGIVETGRLFGPNPLLPVSPLYPGLELVTTAVTQMSGLSVFQAGALLLAAARFSFVAALFLFYERVAGTRAAACGCLVYMGASTFLVFDVQFSYESLAVAFMASALLADARAADRDWWRHQAFVVLPLLGALAVTHHMTAFLTAGLFLALAALEGVRAGSGRAFPRSCATAAVAILLPYLWSKLMGDPGKGYLGPVLENGLREVARIVTLSGGRVPFVSEDGSTAPAWQRAVTVAAVALTCLGLLTGFLRTLARAGLPARWSSFLRTSAFRRFHDGRLVLLALLTLAFPLSVLFRLTHSGWEIGNRVGPFSYLGVGLVVALGALAVPLTAARTLALACGGLCLLIGGIISSQGPRILVPERFQVSADAASVGPMGIAAATWTREWLGPGHLFASDRINRLLLATYGRQDVATTLQDGIDTGNALFARTLNSPDVRHLRTGGIEYVTVDRRLTQALPVVGVYFDGGANDRGYVAPPPPSVLMKFDRAPGAGRAFDNGNIVTYDVRRLDVDR